MREARNNVAYFVSIGIRTAVSSPALGMVFVIGSQRPLHNNKDRSHKWENCAKDKLQDQLAKTLSSEAEPQRQNPRRRTELASEPNFQTGSQKDVAHINKLFSKTNPHRELASRTNPHKKQ